VGPPAFVKALAQGKGYSRVSGIVALARFGSQPP